MEKVALQRKKRKEAEARKDEKMNSSTKVGIWQRQLRKALEAEGYLINGRIYSDKRARGRRYKFSVSKLGRVWPKLASMTEEEKEQADQIVKSIVSDAREYSRFDDSVVTYVRFVRSEEG